MRLEGYKLTAYECPKDVWHYGFGHCTKKTDDIPIKVTYEMALKILKNDVEYFLKGCQELIKVNLNPNQIIALVSFTYNLGIKALEDSTLLERLKKGEAPNVVAEEELPKWRFTTVKRENGYVKVESQGLINRRRQEIEKFKEPVNILEFPEFDDILDPNQQ